MLTGLRQHVGNFPGITVDKRVGHFDFDGERHELVDFPGTYSLYPRSADERVVYRELLAQKAADLDAFIIVLDASNLRRNLLLFTQLYDLGKPCLMVLNMSDLAKREGISIDIAKLQSIFPEAAIVETNARVKLGASRIIEGIKSLPTRTNERFCAQEESALDDIQGQERETALRNEKIDALVTECVSKKSPAFQRSAIDRILIHPIAGFLIFAAILLLIFQAVYSFASIPMDWIDGTFAKLSEWLTAIMSPGLFTDLLVDGIVPGIGGVVIFIPQIALLFLFIGILEESGYLARVVFIMDRIMRPLGLNGRSVVPLMSSVACAIPGVMAARTISNRKERLTTVLVAPLMSCSARIPVYTLLIALVIPSRDVLGVFNLQGLVLLGLYLLGTVMAISVALVLKLILKSDQKSYLLLELPKYKAPRLQNLLLLVWEKVRLFVLDAGKIILAISIVLWALASFGPRDAMNKAEKDAIHLATEQNLNEEERNDLVASEKLEHSYMGYMGKFIEPAIKPLGYDWKIGIALISSFAAREVFVGSMATIYSVHDDGEENKPLLERLRNEKRKDGSAVYTLASGLSLMVFYAFAMMCMATLAVVKRETKSWKWPLIQFGYMGALAYVGAWVTFIIASTCS